VSAALACALALLLAGGPTRTGATDVVEREWTARRWALHAPQCRPEIEAALASEAWTERHLALDALERTHRGAAFAIDQLGGAIEAALADPHPNVRAAALAVFTRAGLPAPAAAAPLARDPFEPVRFALAANLAQDLAVASESDPTARALLATIATGDGRDAQLARAGILTRGPDAWREQLALLRDAEGRLDGLLLLRALPLLERAPVSADLVDALRALVDRGAPGAPHDVTTIELLALHGELDGAAGAPRCDRAGAAAGWVAPPGDAGADGDHWIKSLRRTSLLDAAREGDEALGRLLLLAAAERDEADEEALFLIECATAALPASVAVELARDLDAPLALAVWEEIAPEVGDLDPGTLGPWLSAEESQELRRQVASVVAHSLPRSGDRSGDALLLPLLTDSDPRLRRRAFQWLAAEEGIGDRLEALHRAWRGYAAEERAEYLRLLPRGQALGPFRADLLALCAEPSGRTQPVLELVGALRRDSQVAALLAGWLGEALGGLEDASDLESYRRHEGRAKAIVLALGDGALEALEEALRRALAAPPFLAQGEEHHPELTKTCCVLLGRSRAGRERLAAFLGREVQARARTEAAIQLAGDDELEEAQPGALTALVEGYSRSDSELGVRMLAAVGRLRGSPLAPRASSFLVAVAADDDDDLERRVAAVDALVALGRDGDLAGLLPLASNPEVLFAVAQGLGSLGTPRGELALRSALEEARRRSASTRAGELLLALARSAELTAGELASVLESALALAAGDLRVRFRGGRSAATGFRWRHEIGIAQALAQRGGLDELLAAAGPWWRLDGRLLGVLTVAAREGGDRALALRLADAAQAAIEGEAPAEDLDRIRCRLELARLQLAAEEGDGTALAYCSGRLWARMRLSTRRSATLENALGVFDRRLGVDPVANLDAARWQARAQAALARGDRERALECANQAASRMGASQRARRAQEELSAALSER